jgi:hypothetical protein
MYRAPTKTGAAVQTNPRQKEKAPTKGRGAGFSIPNLPHPPPHRLFPCALSVNTNPKTAPRRIGSFLSVAIFPVD